MNENLEVTPYFSTPVYQGYLPELVDSLNKSSDSFIIESKKRSKNILKDRNKTLHKSVGDFGWSYHSSSLIGLPQFKDLQDYVGNRAVEILDNMGYDLKNHSLIWNELWVQEFSEKGGGHHEGHVHYNNHVSGFYFLKCSEKTSFPIFHDPRNGKSMAQLPLKNMQEISFGTEMINYKPKPGTLIMFPSFLEHQFGVDFGLEPFRFIHFNIQAIGNKK